MSCSHCMMGYHFKNALFHCGFPTIPYCKSAWICTSLLSNVRKKVRDLYPVCIMGYLNALCAVFPQSLQIYHSITSELKQRDNFAFFQYIYCILSGQLRLIVPFKAHLLL